MVSKNRYFNSSSVAGFVCVLLIIMMTGSGCGKGEYSASPENTAASKDDTPSNDTVREYWETLPITNDISVFVLPQAMASKTGKTGNLSLNLSLTQNALSLISASGELKFQGDVISNWNLFSLSYTGETIAINEKTMQITGTGNADTRTESGDFSKHKCQIVIDIMDMSVKYSALVHLTIVDLQITVDFEVEIFRTGDQGEKVSFVNSKWKNTGTSATIDNYSRQYTDQVTVSGITANDPISFKITKDSAITVATGSMSIPSELSPNKTKIDIPFASIPVHLYEEPWTNPSEFKSGIAKFEIIGSMDTMGLDGTTPVTTPYKLLVTLTKTVSMTTHGYGLNYGCNFTLFLYQLGTRTSYSGSISRTDTTSLTASIINGNFVLASGKSYELSHAYTTKTMDTVIKSPVEKIGFSLNLSQSGSGPMASGTIKLPADILAPALSVSFSGLPAVVSDSAITINQYVNVEKTDSMNFTTTTPAMMSLTLKDSVLTCEITGNDLDTHVKITSSVVRTDSGLDLGASSWMLSNQLTLSCQDTSTHTTASSQINEKNLTIDMVLSEYADYALPVSFFDVTTPLLYRSSGGISLDTGIMGHYNQIHIDFSDVPATLSGDSKTMTIQTTGNVSSQSNVKYDLTIVLSEKASGGYRYSISIGLPDYNKIVKCSAEAIRYGGSGYFLQGEQAHFM